MSSCWGDEQRTAHNPGLKTLDGTLNLYDDGKDSVDPEQVAGDRCPDSPSKPQLMKPWRHGSIYPSFVGPIWTLSSRISGMLRTGAGPTFVEPKQRNEEGTTMEAENFKPMTGNSQAWE